MTAALRRLTLDGSDFWDLDGRLIPVLAGAEEPLYPEVPEDLSGLSRDELTALAAEITSRAAIAVDPTAEGRADLIGALSTAEVIRLTQEAIGTEETPGSRDRITAELASRDEAEATEAAALAALATRASGEAEQEADEAEAEDAPEGDDADPDPDAEADAPEAGHEDEAETADQLEAVAAGAMPTADEIAAAVIRAAGRQASTATRRRTSARHAPREDTSGQATVTITAGADIPGFATGAEITDRESIGRAVMRRMRTLANSSSAGDGEKVPVLQIRTELPEERQLGTDAAHNTDVMETILGRQALTAAGGICAPPEPLYDVPTFFVADRPVRDAIPSFNAPRGGITYMQPITIASGIGADMAGASDFWTVADDLSAVDGDPTKDCLRIECGDFVTAEIEAIYRCLTIGNLDARTHPERVAALVDAAIAAQARKAEGRFLDHIKTASTTVSENVGFGALIDFVGAILKVRAGMISRHRMSRDQRFHALMPFWISEALPMDQARGGRPELARAAVASALERYGVSISWYLDTPSTGVTQLFPAQNAAALKDFPTTVQWAMYPEGSFGYLDTGELDLGLVRDSTLNSTNDYQLFAEEFQKVFYRGVEALWINQTVCYSGQVQVAGSMIDCANNITTDTDGS